MDNAKMMAMKQMITNKAQTNQPMTNLSAVDRGEVSSDPIMDFLSSGKLDQLIEAIKGMFGQKSSVPVGPVKPPSTDPYQKFVDRGYQTHGFTDK